MNGAAVKLYNITKRKPFREIVRQELSVHEKAVRQ